MKSQKVKKVVLAYSGGLDTSVILKWLQENYGCEVVTFTADLGQGEELEPARKKAQMLGVKEIFIEDLREEFVRDYVFPMFRANTLYEGVYLLGTSIARPLIAKRQIEIAKMVGADAVAHGATGKGNDQVRFELSYYANKPDIKIIAPWREWDLTSRTKLIDYAEKNQIPVAKDKRGEAPYSVDANLLHTSSEGKVLEDPAQVAPEYVYQRTVSPEAAPDKPTFVEIEFKNGDAVAIDGVKMSPATILTKLNELGGANGIGRLDLVENRFVGMKSRGVYETPGGTILLTAHRAMESITLDREAAHLKDEIMPKYASMIYNGFWFSPEREMLQALIDKSQENVEGKVRLKLYKGTVYVMGRESAKSLYSEAHVTFEEDSVYDQKDAAGFIKLNALRLRIGGKNKHPQYGTFIYDADTHLLSAGSLGLTNMRHAYFHITQAIECYLKAFLLQVENPYGYVSKNDKSKNKSHNLKLLASSLPTKYEFYREPRIVKALEEYSAYNEAARYSDSSKLDKGFNSSELKLMQEIINNLRNDILMLIEIDDYPLGIAVRGSHFRSPNEIIQNITIIAEREKADLLKKIFPELDKFVKWPRN
jgi:argininosuccinate synthase